MQTINVKKGRKQDIIYETILDDRGRVVIPKRMREKLGLQTGDRVVLKVGEDGEK